MNDLKIQHLLTDKEFADFVEKFDAISTKQKILCVGILLCDLKNELSYLDLGEVVNTISSKGIRP